MKLKTFFVLAFSLCILFFATGSFCTENKANETPSVFFPEKRYMFAPVLDGSEVIHDYVVQNKGAATLKIERVKTG